MTLKQFFQKARAGRQWTVSDVTGYVRCATHACPLGAAIDAEWPWELQPLVGNWKVRALHLPKGAARKIANAADKPRSKYRRWLLKNLGVRAPHEETR